MAAAGILLEDRYIQSNLINSGLLTFNLPA